jgi:hypothetical protein
MESCFDGWMGGWMDIWIEGCVDEYVRWVDR